MCDRFPRKFDVQTSYKLSNYVVGLIFVVNIKFPRAAYHTIVPSTEELYCLNGKLILSLDHRLPTICQASQAGRKLVRLCYILFSGKLKDSSKTNEIRDLFKDLI